YSCRARLRRVYLDVDGIGTICRIVVALIHTNREPARRRGEHIALRADQKRFRRIRIADSSNQRASARAIKRKHAEQILKSAGNPFGGNSNLSHGRSASFLSG